MVAAAGRIDGGLNIYTTCSALDLENVQFSRACATLDLQVAGQCICTGFAHLELPQSRTDGGAGTESRACAPLDLDLARVALDLEVHFMLLQALVISPTQGMSKKKMDCNRTEISILQEQTSLCKWGG